LLWISHEYEHAIADLPGFAFNKGTADGEDEIELVSERLLMAFTVFERNQEENYLYVDLSQNLQ